MVPSPTLVAYGCLSQLLKAPWSELSLHEFQIMAREETAVRDGVESRLEERILRAWIERMQARFSAYNHLYSGPFFQPKLAPPKQSPPIERIPYWIGCALVRLLFPLSLATTLSFAALVTRRELR